ncbi:MAG: TadE/TadG family type IV pilus assembly protein [Chloroflexota bacterium]|nr:TadE/TadG family type IV pilus assembly protein [Chloroflexota bacterium]
MRTEKGQSIVELAVLFPLLMLLLMGLLDLGRAYYIMVALRDAAEEGATYAAIDPHDQTEIKARATDACGDLIAISADDVQIATASLTPGEPITVTINYQYDFYMPLAQPFLPEEGLTLRGQAIHPIINP